MKIKEKLELVINNIDKVHLNKKIKYMINTFFNKQLCEIIIELKMFFKYNKGKKTLYNIKLNSISKQIVEMYYKIIDQDLYSLFKICHPLKSHIVLNEYINENLDSFKYLLENIKNQLTNIVSYLERYKHRTNMDKVKIQIINYLNMIFNTEGVYGLSEKKLKFSNYYKNILELNVNNLDFQEFCCKLIDREDDYIIHISVCDD